MRGRLEKLGTLLLAGALVAAHVSAAAAKPPAGGPETYYVDCNEADDPREDGSSRRPFNTIQEGIDAAIDDDTVLVKDGTCLETINFLGKAITVISENGAEFPDGTPRTVIDGNLGGSAVTFAAAAGVQATIEGFTITRGSAVDGGGIHITETTANVNSCVIEGNGATQYGGGIFVQNNGSLYLNNSEVKNALLAGSGGGIAIIGSYANIVDSTISDNLLDEYAANGGGIYSVASSTVVITNSTISGNRCREGGAIYTYSSDLTIQGNSFLTGNHGTAKGGAIYYTDGTLNIMDSHIDNNTSTGTGNTTGAGLLLYRGAPSDNVTIQRSTVKGNQVTGGGSGGGIALIANGAVVEFTNTVIEGNHASFGGGMHILGADPTITNCTIMNNTSNLGGGLSIDANGSTPSDVVVVNSILYDNVPDEIDVDAASIVSVDCSDVKGGWPSTVCANLDAVCGLGTDLHLVEGSPCIDAGTGDIVAFPTLPDDDIDGDSRPLGGGYDIGADEFVAGECLITISLADYDYVNDELEVRATSPYGENANLQLVGYGGMTWDIQGGDWFSLEPETVPPASISVQGDPLMDNCTATIQ